MRGVQGGLPPMVVQVSVLKKKFHQQKKIKRVLINFIKQHCNFIKANVNLCNQGHMLRNSLWKYMYQKSCSQFFKS